MQQTEIIESAKHLMEINKTVEAKELLLQEGYITKLNKDLQDLYLDWFPPSPELQHELNTSLKSLFDEDENERIRASRFIMTQSCSAINKKVRSWARDPRTIELLLKALKDENDEVKLNTIISLGMISRRYDYQDLRILPELRKLFTHNNKKIIANLIGAITHFKNSDKWSEILPAFSENNDPLIDQFTASAIVHYGIDFPEDKKNIFDSLLLERLKNEKKIGDKNLLINAIAIIGSDKIIPEFNELKNKERSPIIKDALDAAIEKIKKRSLK